VILKTSLNRGSVQIRGQMEHVIVFDSNLKKYFETPCSILSGEGLSQEHAVSRFMLEYTIYIYIYIPVYYVFPS
jgi:hypothetical protein